MTTLNEIARLVRAELSTLIQPVQLISVNPVRSSGEVSGRFRSNGMLFDYKIGGGTVSYRPVGSGGRADAAENLAHARMLRLALEASRLGMNAAKGKKNCR